jgi:DNA integrity scanning protein DisA with diadenylate cyclase activity
MMADTTSKLDREFLRSALILAGRTEIDYLLFVSDYPLGSEDLKGRSLRRKLIYAVSSDNLARDLKEEGFRAVVIPGYEYSRMERTKVALVAAAHTFGQGDTVLCVTGHRRSIDTLIKVEIGSELDDSLSVEALRLPPDFDPQVVEQVLGLALAIGQEGFEGRPVGTIVVLGDSIAVLEKSKQLTINPFQGLSESERNILDPRIKEAVKNFSVLDGAFIIREDGVVLAAGRYLQSGGSDELKIPLGLGARHAAAALMTATTKALALVVSQTSGTVRIFRNGDIIFELHQSKRRI